MLDGIDNSIQLFLRLNRSTPLIQTIREIPGIVRRQRSEREKRTADEPIYYTIVRRNPGKFLHLLFIPASSPKT